MSFLPCWKWIWGVVFLCLCSAVRWPFILRETYNAAAWQFGSIPLCKWSLMFLQMPEPVTIPTFYVHWSSQVVLVVVQSLSRVWFWLFVTPWSQHTRLACPSPSSTLLKITSIESVMPSTHLILCHPLSFCLQSFPASGSFPISHLSTSGGQNVGASASVFPINTQGWFPLGFKESTANAGDIRDSDTAPDWKDPLEESMTSTSVFLPGGSHGQSSLVDYSL